jgi:DNA-binding PadR family transcriptional regulator
MTDPKATQTSYAVLGLLAIQPWTTYELARQSERSLRWFFPRAERAVYLEAKRLVELGWATARKTATGKRASTVYRITAAGRRALHAWLAQPSTPTHLESEPALKLFFADQAGDAELRATIAAIRQHAADALAQLAAMAHGEPRFPARMSTNVLSMRLIVDVHEAIARWTEWADEAADVLDRGSAEAIAAQTSRVLSEIGGAAATARR